MTVTPTTTAAAAAPANRGSTWPARSRTCSIARRTFFFGLTRSEMASMVRASSARVRSMSATSASWSTGFALVSASAITCSVSWPGPEPVPVQSPRPFGMKRLSCQVHHDLYITWLPGEHLLPRGQRDAAVDQAAEPGRIGLAQRLDGLLVVAARRAHRAEDHRVLQHHRGADPVHVHRQAEVAGGDADQAHHAGLGELAGQLDDQLAGAGALEHHVRTQVQDADRAGPGDQRDPDP